jgi:hypothetical protein
VIDLKGPTLLSGRFPIPAVPFALFDFSSIIYGMNPEKTRVFWVMGENAL